MQVYKFLYINVEIHTGIYLANLVLASSLFTHDKEEQSVVLCVIFLSSEEYLSL